MSHEAIALRGVTKVLGGRRVLDGVSIDVDRGEIVALMGPSGAGKTVTVKHVLGLHLPDRGDVFIEGESIPSMSAEAVTELTARRLGVMLQGRGLFGSRTLLDNVADALAHRGTIPAHERHGRALEWLARLGLADHRDTLPADLSVGMRTRASLARALAVDAPILVLDDLEAGLDGVRVNLVADVVRDVHAARGCTVLLTTHQPALADRLGARTVILAGGRIRDAGDRDFAQAFLGGDRRLEHELWTSDIGRRAAPGDDQPAADRLRLALLALALVVLAGFAVFWLVPILRGDVNLNPFF